MTKRSVTQAYTTNDVRTANRLQLLIMLYDSAIRFMTLARRKLEEGDIAGKGQYIGKAMAIISEFKGTLDHDKAPDLARNLERLYTFINDSLVMGNMRNDAKSIEAALSVTSTLREGWVELSRQMDAGDASVEHAARGQTQDSCVRISV
ncbi:MAG: flagellar export chaperone FliS [Deltaproteobacteria bacterium]|nr:flagellar export chaperone FliS [Deltaproteobacteria bacterium]